MRNKDILRKMEKEIRLYLERTWTYNEESGIGEYDTHWIQWKQNYQMEAASNLYNDHV